MKLLQSLKSYGFLVRKFQNNFDVLFLTMHLCIRIMGIGAVSFTRLFAFNLAPLQGAQCSLWQHIFSTTYASNDFWVIYELQMLQNGHCRHYRKGLLMGFGGWLTGHTVLIIGLSSRPRSVTFHSISTHIAAHCGSKKESPQGYMVS